MPTTSPTNTAARAIALFPVMPSGLSYSPGAALSLFPDKRQRHRADEHDAGREPCPVPTELSPRLGVGGDGARFVPCDRCTLARRIHPQRPGDLHIAGFIEVGKFLTRYATKYHVGVPRLRDGAHHDLV